MPASPFCTGCPARPSFGSLTTTGLTPVAPVGRRDERPPFPPGRRRTGASGSPSAGPVEDFPCAYAGRQVRQTGAATVHAPAQRIERFYEPFMGGLSMTILLIKTGRVAAFKCDASDICGPAVDFF